MAQRLSFSSVLKTDLHHDLFTHGKLYFEMSRILNLPYISIFITCDDRYVDIVSYK